MLYAFHTCRACERLVQPAVNALSVVDVHARQQSDVLTSAELHHADHAPAENHKTIVQSAVST